MDRRMVVIKTASVPGDWWGYPPTSKSAWAHATHLGHPIRVGVQGTPTPIALQRAERSNPAAVPHGRVSHP